VVSDAQIRCLMRSDVQIKVIDEVKCADQGALWCQMHRSRCLMRSSVQIKVLGGVRCTDQGA